ncbi:MAG: hypothetical protein M3Y50_00280 [Acidobacteriota bacterium]|nr:hypothetical protein [Acidobacteriota bacterium]
MLKRDARFFIESRACLCSAQGASAIAVIVKQRDGDLRLAPWPGTVFGAMPATAAKETLELLQSLGLSSDRQDGFHGIAACAGSTGCDATLADVRGVAASLAERLSGKIVPPGWTINLSGCDKQCARRHGAYAELIANDSGFHLKINGESVQLICSPDSAIGAVVAFHTERLSGVVSL